MAYLTVTTQADVVDPGDGQLSLREAVAQANASAGADTIRFVAALQGQALVLTGGELLITDSLMIDGRGLEGHTTIDANHASRVLKITGGGTETTLAGLNITNGRSYNERGGGIFLGAQSGIELMDCIVSGNDTGDGTELSYGADGGGLFADKGSRLLVEGGSFSGNNAAPSGYYAFGHGGAIAADGSNVLIIRSSRIAGNFSSFGGGISVESGSTVTIETTSIVGNVARDSRSGGGGGISIVGSTIDVYRSSIASNNGNYYGGGIFSVSSDLTIDSTSIVGNHSRYGRDTSPQGGGVLSSGPTIIRNSTVTGNTIRNAADDARYIGGGAGISAGASLEMSNTIVAGNRILGLPGKGPDIFGTIAVSNGHNVLGSTVAGSNPGDRQDVPPALLFAQVDPATGGGKLAPSGVVPLKNAVTNPALSGADPLTARALDQTGVVRPLPAGSLSDLGAAELKQTLSTKTSTNNDVLAGTSTANNLLGYAGNDLLKGLGGADSMDGGEGSDVLEGGPGNDTLKGGLGVDLVTYPGPAKVTVDLAAKPAKAKRGGETNTLIGIEGAIGSDGADTFKGDINSNAFQGGLGKDTYTGGGGRDTYDFDKVQDSPAGAGRDVITDFVPGQDVIDLAGIDGDRTAPGNQGFRWVGQAALTASPPGQVGYYVSGNMTIIRVSNDADAAPEIEIQLNGTKTPTPGDFRF